MEKIWESQLIDSCFLVLQQKLHSDLPSKNIFITHHSSIHSNACSFFEQIIENQQTCKGICYIVFSYSFSYYCLVPERSYTSRQNPRDYFVTRRKGYCDRGGFTGRLILGNSVDKADRADADVCRTLQSLSSTLKADDSAQYTGPA